MGSNNSKSKKSTPNNSTPNNSTTDIRQIIDELIPETALDQDKFKVNPPSVMPPEIIQRMKDLKCPPPISASKINPRIKALNASISKQSSDIEILEKLIYDLEKRYRISFTTDGKPQYDLKSGDVPQLLIGGNLKNIEIKPRLWSAEPGISGNKGIQGDQGNKGNTTITGDTGVDGYYGTQGEE